MEDKRRNEKIYRRILAVSFGVLGLTVAGMLYMGLVLKRFGVPFVMLICGGLLLFWLLMDVVSPVLTHEFEGKTPQQMTSYRAMAAMELIGYAGLAYFCVSLNSQNGFYGALVYAATLMMKRRFQEDYRRDPEEDKELAQKAEELSEIADKLPDADGDDEAEDDRARDNGTKDDRARDSGAENDES